MNDWENPYDEEEEAGAEPIAILSMAGRFPRAYDLETFWRNLRDGVECISFFADDELEHVPDPKVLANPKFVRARGVLDRAEYFDASFFEISPRVAELIDPQQLPDVEYLLQSRPPGLGRRLSSGARHRQGFHHHAGILQAQSEGPQRQRAKRLLDLASGGFASLSGPLDLSM